MFTGLIQDIGTITSITENREGRELTIETTLTPEIQIDDSVATNGVCLTATKIQGKSFRVQAVATTLSKSNLGELRVGDKVNLELSLRPHDRLGGHFVQGHVNGMGKIVSRKAQGKSEVFELSFPKELRKYMISEGSIAVDGISLTIASLSATTLGLALIPHTLEKTTLGSKRIGDTVNLEVDMMAKYIENFWLTESSKKDIWTEHFQVHYED